MNGLPDLPAGEWWEVRENLGYDGYKVCIVKTVKTPEHKKRNPWGFRVTVPASEEVKVIAAYRIAEEDEKNPYRNKQHITADDVRRTAEQMIQRRERWAESRTRKLESDALLGAYPPKVLP